MKLFRNRKKELEIRLDELKKDGITYSNSSYCHTYFFNHKEYNPIELVEEAVLTLTNQEIKDMVCNEANRKPKTKMIYPIWFEDFGDSKPGYMVYEKEVPYDYDIPDDVYCEIHQKALKGTGYNPNNLPLFRYRFDTYEKANKALQEYRYYILKETNLQCFIPM